jgi:hypothetical protein
MVHVPFTDKETGELYEADKEITLTEERVAEVKAFDVNLISELGEVKPKRSRKK